jgi:hypothetical protein
MTSKTKNNALAAAPGMPTDPVLLARWQAIRAAGGASHVARELGYSKGEGVRLWYVNRDPTAEQARKLVQMAGGVVTLAQVLPSAYADLTAAELGYTPQ